MKAMIVEKTRFPDGEKRIRELSSLYLGNNIKTHGGDLCYPKFYFEYNVENNSERTHFGGTDGHYYAEIWHAETHEYFSPFDSISVFWVLDRLRDRDYVGHPMVCTCGKKMTVNFLRDEDMTYDMFESLISRRYCYVAGHEFYMHRKQREFQPSCGGQVIIGRMIWESYSCDALNFYY
jgi:hypothetical protein